MRDSNKLPVFEQIYHDFRKKIFSGVLSPGDMLPSEKQLCTEYKASRETVRKGLSKLVGEGLVFSRPKVGYFVCRPDPNHFRLGFCEELELFRIGSIDMHGEEANEEICKILRIPKGRFVICFSQLIIDTEGIPAAFDIRYIPYERSYPTVERDMRFAVYPDQALEKMESFSAKKEIRVEAVAADQKIAEVLKCELGTPLLLVRRTFLQQDGGILGHTLRYLRPPYGFLVGNNDM